MGDLGLTEAQQAKYREQFDAIDLDKGGSIDAEELLPLAAMLSSKDSVADVEVMMACWTALRCGGAARRKRQRVTCRGW